MGLYVQKENHSHRDLRRKSVDDLDGYEIEDDGKSIDLGRDSVINPDDILAILRKQRKETTTYRVRKTTNKLLHTHVALILVCVLSSLDAACVIGQIICDILIMSDSLYENELLHERATDALFILLPEYLNKSQHGTWSFESIVEHLEEVNSHNKDDNQTVPHANDDHSTGGHMVDTGGHRRRSASAIHTLIQKANFHTHMQHHRSKRAAASSDDPHAAHKSHTVLEELTHIFHIGSMAILSALVLEIFFKIFAMWKHFLDHRLEVFDAFIVIVSWCLDVAFWEGIWANLVAVFDAFIVIVSWCLDVAFWEGIWARPGQEGVTILIIILPWRVVRIVNSFVLVIKEKDLVLLKVIKQRLRAALRREKDSTAKLDRYRLEVRHLQGLCRKHGADEGAIQACNPAGKRRRSSLFSSLTSLASVAFVSAIGNQPDVDRVSSSSSSEDEDDSSSPPKRLPWLESVGSSETSNPVSFTLTPETGETPVTAGIDNEVFKYDDETIAKFGSKDIAKATQTITDTQTNTAEKTRL